MNPIKQSREEQIMWAGLTVAFFLLLLMMLDKVFP